MSRFSYHALSREGQRVQGTVRGQDRRAALQKLLELGCHPLRLEVVGETGSRTGGIRRLRLGLRRVSVAHLAVLTRQLACLLKAGLPMRTALATLRSQCEQRRLKAVLLDMEEAISREGCSLTHAMEDHPQVFDPVYRGVVRAGEEAGNLATVLGNLASHLSKAAVLKRQVLTAFLYPAFLLVLGTVAVLVLMAFVIPKFSDLFASFGQQLPLPTRCLMVASGFLATWWWALLATLCLGAGAAHHGMKNVAIRRRLHRGLLRLPVLGAMFLRLEMARVATTLAALLNSGVQITETLRIAGETVRNLAVKATFPPIITAVATGEPLSRALERTGVFPPLVVNLIRTGEETGELPEMLEELSSIYEDEAARAVTGAVRLLEPTLILVMGAIVAGIVAAVMLPILRANLLVT